MFFGSSKIKSVIAPILITLGVVELDAILVAAIANNAPV